MGELLSGHACTLTYTVNHRPGYKLSLVCQDDGGSASMFAEVTLSWLLSQSLSFVASV